MSVPPNGMTTGGGEVQEHQAEYVSPDDIATAVIKRVAELSDRTSPDDWPEAMLVTADELRFIIVSELAEE